MHEFPFVCKLNLAYFLLLIGPRVIYSWSSSWLNKVTPRWVTLAMRRLPFRSIF